MVFLLAETESLEVSRYFNAEQIRFLPPSQMPKKEITSGLQLPFEPLDKGLCFSVRLIRHGEF